MRALQEMEKGYYDYSRGLVWVEALDEGRWSLGFEAGLGSRVRAYEELQFRI